jgi:multidrug efflux pump subunit AcrB
MDLRRTNIVRQDGHRGTLTVLKSGNASTLDVVQGIRNLLPRVAATLPPELKIQPWRTSPFCSSRCGIGNS